MGQCPHNEMDYLNAINQALTQRDEALEENAALKALMKEQGIREEEHDSSTLQSWRRECDALHGQIGNLHDRCLGYQGEIRNHKKYENALHADLDALQKELAERIEHPERFGPKKQDEVVVAVFSEASRLLAESNVNALTLAQRERVEERDKLRDALIDMVNQYGGAETYISASEDAAELLVELGLLINEWLPEDPDMRRAHWIAATEKERTR